MNEDCLMGAAMETFTGRWTTQVLYCIHFGLNRFGLIKKQLPLVSDQVLGLRLHHLIEHKLVIKKDKDGEKTYALTEKGRGLIGIFESLVEWHTQK